MAAEAGNTRQRRLPQDLPSIDIDRPDGPSQNRSRRVSPGGPGHPGGLLAGFRTSTGAACSRPSRVQLSGNPMQALCDTPDERLINSLVMICPFSGPEKQALLEAPDLAERAKVLTALIEMAVLDTDDGDGEKTRQ